MSKVIAIPGEIIILSNGEHDDYYVLGVYKVLNVINEQVVEDISKKIKNEYGYMMFGEIVQELISNKYIARVNTKEVYLGSYSELNLRIR